MNIKETNVRVWQPEKVRGSKIVQANITCYEGEDQNGNPKYSNWSGRFVGDAYKKAQELEDGQKIGIFAGSVSTYYDKDKKKLYANLTIFDFDEPFDFSKKGKK